METVWIYFNKHYKAGHPDCVRVFATRETAERWLAEIDPRGSVFEYKILDNGGLSDQAWPSKTSLQRQAIIELEAATDLSLQRRHRA